MAADLILANQGIQFADGSVQPSAAQPAIVSLTASIAANAITVTLAPCSLAFRNTTLTTGTPTYVNTNINISIVIAATDSFGLVTAYGNQRLAILAINNAGIIELAASALYGGVSLDETGVITTAITSTTATGIKATSVRTGVAYRVVGFLDVTFTTAVGWGSLVLVQGAGGQALAAMSSLGYGQTWQNLSGSRAWGTTYYNTTGRSIFIHAGAGSPNVGNNLILTIAGVVLYSGLAAAGDYDIAISAVIPPGASYAIASPGGGTVRWQELR